MSYSKIQKTEGVKLRREKDSLIIKFSVECKRVPAKWIFIYFYFKVFYSDIVKFSDNNAGVWFHSNICEYGEVEEGALFSFSH
jgi:hypothetical protein